MAGVISGDGALDDRRTRYNLLLGGGESGDSSVTSYAVPVVLGLLVLLGVIGNGSIIYTVCKYKKMKNVPNAFVVNIAVADLLLLFLVAPFIAAYYIFESWQLGAFLCKMTEAIQTFSVALSMFSITALSIERYAAFASPPRRRRIARKRACVGILIMWILSAICALPDAMSALIEHKLVGDQIVKRCMTFTAAWGPLYPKIHTIVSACVLFGVPLLLVNIFYMSLGCVVCGKKRREKLRRPAPQSASEMQPLKVSVHSSGDSFQKNGTLPYKSGTVSTRTGTISGQISGGTLVRSDQEASKRDSSATLLHKRHAKKRKTMAKVAVFMCFQFVVLWAPRYAYRSWLYFDVPNYTSSDDDIWFIIKLAGLGSIFLNAALVPFAVISCNRAFRRRLSKYLCCCCNCGACCIDDGETSNSSKARSKKAGCCPCCWDEDDDSDLDDLEGAESDYQTTDTYRHRYLDAFDGGQRGTEATADRLEYSAPGVPQGREGPYGTRNLNDYAYLQRPFDGQYAEPTLLRFNPVSSGYLHAEPPYAEAGYMSSYQTNERQSPNKFVNGAAMGTAADSLAPPAAFDSQGVQQAPAVDQVPAVYI